MPLLVNLHHLDRRSVRLTGELPAGELDLDTRDEMIRLGPLLRHDLEVEKLEEHLLVRGELELALACQCVRCLEPFSRPLRLADWLCDVPLTGEERAPVNGDCVDLTPYVREDILLALPQHPLCRPDCAGLTAAEIGKANTQRGAGRTQQHSSAWTALDKLRF
jgi:uncharacterized protein